LGQRRPSQPAVEDDEADADAAPAGAGWRGRGKPMTVGSGSQERPLEDGAGLCSPGRWLPQHRKLPTHSVAHALGQRLAEEASRLFGDGNLLARIATGSLEEDPFPPEKTTELRGWYGGADQEGIATEDANGRPTTAD